MEVKHLKEELLKDVKNYIHTLTSVTPQSIRKLADWASVLNMFDHYKHELWLDKEEHVDQMLKDSHAKDSYLAHNPY